MLGAVTQLLIVQARLLSTLTRQLGHATHRFALTLVGLDRLEHHLGDLGVHVEVVVELLLEEVADKLLYRHAPQWFMLKHWVLRHHLFGAQLDLRLTLELRLDDANADCCCHARANVPILKALARKLLDDTSHLLAKGCQVGTSLCGVLTIDKAVKLLSVLLNVCDSDLYVGPRETYDRVERIARDGV